MDMHKFIYKSKFRLRKVSSFFKLKYYGFLKKFHLEGENSFYYHLQSQLLRDILRTSAEYEYLSNHGLLSENETEEMDLGKDAEPEKEDGLIRTLSLGEIRPISLKDSCYIATEVKEYEDRVCISLQISGEGTDSIREEMVCAPHEANHSYDHFCLDGLDWRWDREDCMLRPSPHLTVPAEVKVLQDGVLLFDGQVLRVEKALADEKLSPLCLEYACCSGPDGYEWCLADYSALTALFELNIPVPQTEFYLSCCCCRYWKTVADSSTP